MKRYLIISLLALAACNSSSDNSKKDDRLPVSLVNNPHSASGLDTKAAELKPLLTFADTIHNFGPIHEDEKVYYDFTFTNTGKSPLLINSATGSCGCTVAEFPHDPIEPGKGGTIKVSFNSSGKVGHQVKSVTLQTNTLRNIHMLYIQADVAKK